PLVADGFTARRENVAVFSGKRLDEAFTALDKNNQALWQTSRWKREDLLKGKGLDKAPPIQAGLFQTMALVHKCMEEESERAASSHEVIRQLLAATEMLPRNVMAPEWIQFGMPSFFETPVGASWPAFWPGVGAPSWNYRVKFKLLEDDGKLKPSQAP